MALATNSYGALTGVAARTPRWANGGTFDATTTPTITQAEGFIDEVSAIVNLHLQELDYDIPITQADVKLLMNMFVNDEVASIVLGIHGSGRFAPKAGKSAGTGESRFVRILNDFKEFITTHQYGMAKLGVDGGGNLQIFSSYDDDVEPLLSRDTLDIA